MAAVTLLGTQAFDTNSGTHSVTATPAVGDLIVIVVANTGSTSSVAPTDNNSGGTYTLINSAVKAGSVDTMRVYVRNALINSASSTIFTQAPGTTTGGGIAVLKITGMSLAGASAIRQSAIQSNQAANTTPTPVFSSAVLTANAVIGAVFNATNPATLTPRTSYTERVDVGYATPTTGLEIMSRDSGETGTSIAWGGTSASAFCSIAIELAFNTAPTVTLNSPTDAATSISVTPTVNFTGTDANADAIEYNVHLAKELGQTSLFSDSSLVAYYKLENNGNDSKNSNHGTSNNVTYSTDNGFFGQGGSFNGSSTNISIPNTTAIDINGVGSKVSVSAWFRITAGAIDGYIVRKGFETSNGSNYSMGAIVSNGKYRLFFRVLSSVGRAHYGSTELHPDRWYHAVITCTHGDAVPVMYVNGVAESSYVASDTSASSYSFVSNTNPLTIGSSSNNTNYFNGSIDDVAVFNKILTATEVASLYGLSEYSTVDSGFTSGHPFASGVAKDFTVQPSEALSNSTTYTWRVRAIDSTGSNTYGAFSSNPTFTTAAAGTIASSSAGILTILERAPLKSTTAVFTTLERSSSTTTALSTTLEQVGTKTTTAVHTTLEKPTQSAASALVTILEKAPQRATTAVLTTLEKTGSTTAAIVTSLEKSIQSSMALSTIVEKPVQPATVAVYTELEGLTITGNRTASITTTLEKSVQSSTTAVVTILEQAPQRATTALLTTLEKSAQTTPVGVLTTLEKAGKATSAVLTILEQTPQRQTMGVSTLLEVKIQSTVALTTTLENTILSERSMSAVTATLERQSQTTTAVSTLLEQASQRSTVALSTTLDKGATHTTAVSTTLGQSAETLVDNFDLNTLDLSKWLATANVVNVNSRIEITTTTAANYFDLHSVNTYDLRNSFVSAQLIEAGNQSLVSYETVLFARLDSSNQIYWSISNNQINVKQQVAGVYSTVYATAYNSAVHKWFRIRESAGVSYFDHSTDGVTWTNAYSMSNPFRLESLTLAVQAGNYLNETLSTVAIWDNINSSQTIQRGTTGILTILERSANFTTVALTTTLEKAPTVTTVGVSTLLEKQAQASTTALTTQLERTSLAAMALLTTLEKPARSTLNLSTSLERTGVNQTVGGLTILEVANRASTVALYTTVENANNTATVGVSVALEKVRVLTVGIVSMIEAPARTSISLSTQLERIARSTTAMLTTLESGTRQSTTALAVELVTKTNRTVALSSILERSRNTSTVSILTELEGEPKTTVGVLSDLQRPAITPSIALLTTLELTSPRTFMNYSMQSAPPSSLLKGSAIYIASNASLRLNSNLDNSYGAIEALGSVSSFRSTATISADNGPGDSMFFYWGGTTSPTSKSATFGGYLVAFSELENKIMLYFNGTLLASAVRNFLATAIERSAVITVSRGTTHTTISVTLSGDQFINITELNRSVGGTRFGWGANNLTGGSPENAQHHVKEILVAETGATIALITTLEQPRKQSIGTLVTLETARQFSTIAITTDLVRKAQSSFGVTTTLEQSTQQSVGVATLLESVAERSAVGVLTLLEVSEQVSPVALATILEHKGQSATVAISTELARSLQQSVALTAHLERKETSTVALLTVLESNVSGEKVSVLTMLEHARKQTVAISTMLEATYLGAVAVSTDLIIPLVRNVTVIRNNRSVTQSRHRNDKVTYVKSINGEAIHTAHTSGLTIVRFRK